MLTRVVGKNDLRNYSLESFNKQMFDTNGI